jgi:hypothetical protein
MYCTRGHHDRDFAEVESVKLLELLLASHKRVMPDIKVLDRYPNIDGYLTLQGENCTFMGKFEAQVKTLPERHNLKAIVSCDFIKYCKIASLPVLYIGVDRKNEIAYWLHIDNDIIDNTTFHNTDSIHIDLSSQQIISKSDKKYIDDFTIIAKKHYVKLYGMSAIGMLSNNQVKHLSSSEQLNESTVRNIQIYLDRLNELIDKNYPSVKSRFFKDTWKLGFALHDYESKSLKYSLYRIPYGEIDDQIRFVDIDKISFDDSKTLSTGFFAVENPIKERNIGFAYEIVFKYISKLIKMRMLSIKSISFLNIEFIFAFVDNYYKQMGLERKDKYSITELRKGFYNYLQIWIEEALKLPMAQHLMTNININGYIDPAIISMVMDDQTFTNVDNVAQARLNNNDYSKYIFRIHNKDYPPIQYIECLDYYNETGIEVIERPFLKGDIDLSHRRSFLLWERYSAKTLEKNLRLFFNNLQKVYNEFLTANFPYSLKELELFKDIDKMIVVFNADNKYTSKMRYTSLDTYYVMDNGLTQNEIEVINGESIQQKYIFDEETNQHIVEIGKRRYILRESSHSTLRFIYSKTPMQDYIYELIQKKIENQLKPLFKEKYQE